MDIQSLFHKVKVRPNDECSRLFPDALACKITVQLKGGILKIKGKRDYEGFFTRPLSWNSVVKKFDSLCSPAMDKGLRRKIVDAVANLEEIKIAELMRLLGKVPS